MSQFRQSWRAQIPVEVMMIIFRSELQREQNFLADTEPVAWKQHYHKYLNRLFVFLQRRLHPPSLSNTPYCLLSLCYTVLDCRSPSRQPACYRSTAVQWACPDCTSGQMPIPHLPQNNQPLVCLVTALSEIVAFFFFFYCNRYPLSCKVAHDGHEAR